MPSSPSAHRPRLTLLLAIAGALFIGSAATALADVPGEIVFAGEGAGWVKGQEGDEGGEPHVECHWNGTEIDVGIPGPGECETTAKNLGIGAGGILVSAEADSGSLLYGWELDEQGGLVFSTGSCSSPATSQAEGCGALAFGVVPIKITATFIPIPKPKLTINEAGAGAGQVNCEVNGEPDLDEPCAKEYEEGTELKLIAAHGAHSTFEGFENAGGDASACTTSPCGPFTLEEDSELDARFELIPHTLTVEATGEGAVDAEGSPVPLSGEIAGCEESGGECSAEYGEGQTVLLQAAPGEHKVVQWTGCASAVANLCEVEIPAGDATVEAEFVSAPQHTLTVEATGEGSVSAGEPPVPASGGISGCEETGGECSATYYQGDHVTLTASPGAHTQPVWSGCATAVGNSCEVAIGAANATVEVQFAQITHTLSIGAAGSGSGSVSCDGGTCAPSYPEGATVTLVAGAASGSTFAGWSGGGCSGTGSCAVTLNADTAVSATFNANPQPAPKPSPPPQPEQKGTATAKGTAAVNGNAAMLTLNCAGGECKGSLELHAKVKQGKKQKDKTIGKASFAIAAGGSATVKVKITDGQIKKLLGMGKTVKAQLKGTGIAPRAVKLKPQGARKSTRREGNGRATR